jgi:hypothetical protein
MHVVLCVRVRTSSVTAMIGKNCSCVTCLCYATAKPHAIAVTPSHLLLAAANQHQVGHWPRCREPDAVTHCFTCERFGHCVRWPYL